MDICLIILADPAEGSTYRPGDIVEVSLQGSSPCRHPRLVMIKINDVPDKAPPDILLRRLKLGLCSEIKDASNLANMRVIRRRRWSIDYSLVPKSIKDELRDNKEVTGTWEQLKSVLVRRIVNVEEDDTQDTLIVITEDDL